jgi:hypothetical protein
MDDEPSSPGLFWVEEFDLSSLTYPQFLVFFFDRPVVDDKEKWELFRGSFDYFVASTPATVVDHLHRMCCDLSALTKVYSHEQIDQGLWAVFGAGISCEQYLFDPSVDQKARIECIESMYLPFRDVVAKSRCGKRDSFYWMWWDMILHANALHYTPSSDARQMIEAIYETLLRILALNGPACQWSALHGLGHLPHPEVRPRVEEYLRLHRAELTEEDTEWVERCAAGKIA